MAFAGDMVINLLGTTKGLDRALARGRSGIRGFVSGITSPLRGFKGMISGVVGKFMSGMKAMARSAKRAAQVIGIALVTTIGLAIAKQIEFDDAIRKAGARAEASARGIETLRDRAKELGLTTSFTATEVANMMEGLAQGGFLVEDITQGMTDAVAQLSRSTGTDPGETARLISATMKVFKKDVDEASSVADMFTVVANSSLTTIEELAEGWKFAATEAAATGTSAEELAASFATLANANVKGSVAGTAMRRMLTLTAAQAEELSDIFKVDFKDANDDAFSLVDNMANLGHAINNAGGNTIKLAKLYEAFGLRGVTASEELTKNFAETDAMVAKIHGSTDIALKTMQAIEAGPGGAWRLFKSAVQGLRIELGEKLTPVFIKVMKIMTERTRNTIKFIKDKWQTWQDRLEEIFVTVKAAWDFAWANAGDVSQLALAATQLAAVKLKGVFLHVFQEVIPAAFSWFKKTWPRLVIFMVKEFRRGLMNMAVNFKAVLNAIEKKIRGGKFVMPKMRTPFKRSRRDDLRVPSLKIPEREKNELEKELEGIIGGLKGKLGPKLASSIQQALFDLYKSREGRNKPLDDTQAPTFEGKKREFAAGGGVAERSRDMVGVLQRGSAEAFKQIFAGGGVPQKQLDAQLRLEKIAAMQLAVQERAEKREAISNTNRQYFELIRQGAVP